MTELSLNISDDTEAVHGGASSDARTKASYTVVCDALEVLGVSHVKGDVIELPTQIGSTLLQLNQVKGVK